MPRKDVQSNVGTITSPFSVPHSWGMLTVEDSVNTAAMSSKQSTLVFRYRRLTRPKHQSQLNLVWPVSRNDSVIFLCRPVRTRHIRYCIMQVFLFCPQQLSAWRCTSCSPKPYFSKKKCSNDTTQLAPFPVLTLSSSMKLTCLGNASQATPKRPHLRGHLK